MGFPSRFAVGAGPFSGPPAILPAAVDGRDGAVIGSREASVLAPVAHELRGPVMALTLAAEVLVQDAGTLRPGRLHDLLQAMHARTLWLQGLVENLLYAALAEQGRVHMQPAALDLREVAAEIRPVVAPILQQRGQRLTVRARGAPSAIRADGRRIGQVLVNLILNASKYSPLGAPIGVVLTPGRRPGTVRVAVEDRGRGLPPGAAERLFQPFYRPSAARATADGVGLGLAIVRSVVEAHGGRVGAENRPGGGARFWFELPERGAPGGPAHPFRA
jgi:two-component system sensor histidine kinase KdpD